MKSLETILATISKIVDDYESGKLLTQEKLTELHRSLSTNVYFLTKENIDAYNTWNTIIYTRPERESVAAARVRADSKCPELRITRKIMEACKAVSISMQNEIKIMKND